MATPIVVYRGGTDMVLARSRPGTKETELWQAFETSDSKGILQGINGNITCADTAVAHGKYRFYADDELGEQQSQGGLLRRPYICSVVCSQQACLCAAATGQLYQAN